MKKMVLVKFGGGLIAPKNWEPETADEKIIERLVKEIDGILVAVAVGSGNFGHAAVKKYGIADEINVERVRIIAKKIGQIVADKIKNSQLIITHEKPWKVTDILDAGKTPVIYGDVMGINEIWSGERCLAEMIIEMSKKFKIERIIQVSIEDGVWDSSKKIIPEINNQNWSEIKKNVSGVVGGDATGGMLHKVEESLEIAKKYGIETWIVSGKVAERVRDAVSGKKVVGTVIV